MKNVFFGLIATLFMFSFGWSQISDSKGLEHNDLLRNVLINMNSDINKSNVYEQVLSIMQNNLKRDISDAFKFSSYDSGYSMLEDLKSKSMISNSIYNYVKMDLDNTSKMGSYIEVQKYVNAKRLNELKNLNQDDLTQYEGFLSVLKHSTFFWDEQGENGFKYFNLDHPTTLQKDSRGPNGNIDITFLRINWWKVAGCDAVAGLLTGGTATVAASACAVIMQL